MGTPDFSATVLQGLLDNKEQYEILAVVTQPDRKVGRKHELRQTPVKALAVESGLKVIQPEKLSGSAELEEIISLGADGIVTAAFGQFLPEKLLNAVGFAVNVHASLLPKYRGGAPIHYALINGDNQIGVTIMEMVKQMDAGAMIAQDSIPILDEDNVGTLFDKIAILGCDLLLKVLPDYVAGNIQVKAQDESQATFSPNIAPEEEIIDWNKSARQIFNQVRGMNPWPVTHTTWNKERLKIYQVKEVEGLGQAGQVLEKTKKSLIIGTGNGAIELLVVQPAGKPQMDIVSFLNGLGQKIKVGDSLGK